MTIDQLLQDVETLPHTARVQTMITLGKRSQTDAELAALLNKMASGEWYERFLALYACFGSLNTEQVLAALDDPSRIIRGLALRLLPLVCSPAQLQQTLATVSPALRLPLFWKLTKHGHSALIDAFIEQLSPNEPQFCKLLCFASEAIVLRFAPIFRRKALRADWSDLARLQPAATLEMLIQWANTGEQEDKPSASLINLLLPLLLPAHPERCLELVTTLLRFIPLSALKLQCLANTFPFEVTDIILAQKEEVRLEWEKFFPGLSGQRIIDLCEKQKYISNTVGTWFPLLSQETRLFLYNHGKRFLASYYSEDLPYTAIAALPTAQREEVGRAQLLSSKKNQSVDLNYAAFLPWDEVLEELEPHIHSSNAEHRAEALFAQIGAIRYHRDQLPAVLERLLQRRTEHDGVRKGILFALVGVPVVFWQEEHLAHLAEIIRHGLNDVGMSQETLRAILKLLLRLLPYHFAWAAQQLSVVLRERGFLLPKPGSESDFMSSKVPQIYIEPALRKELLSLLQPILQTWVQQENETGFLDLVEYLAPRGTLSKDLEDLLLTLLQQTQTAETAKRALRLLANHEPQQFARQVPVLLQNDASWITQPTVSDYLLHSRQDLLTPFLTNQTYNGRFSTGRKRFLPPLTHNATCLTANQQKRFASALLEQVHEQSQDSRVAAQIIKNLAFLPANPVIELLQLARDQNSLIRTNALFTLGRLDGNNAVPELLAALQDSRARIAIVVLRPLLLRMPPNQALAYLRAVPQTRVTVAKETIRLIGDLTSEEAYRELLALEQQELHHDVRIALLNSLWKHTEYAETWTTMERVIQDPNPEIAVEAIPGKLIRHKELLAQRIEATGLTFHQHFLRLAVLLLQHPTKDIRFRILQRYTNSYSQLKGTDNEHIVLPLLAHIIETEKATECSKAAQAFFQLCSLEDTAQICQLFRARLSEPAILEEMVDALDDLEEEQMLPIIRAVLAVLATAPITTLLRLQLATSHLSAEELFPFLADLATKNELHAEALAQACKSIDRDLRRFDLPVLEKLEQEFSASEDERLRRLGLAFLLEQADRANSWSAAYLDRLRQYRADPSLMVATVALFTFPEEEE